VTVNLTDGSGLSFTFSINASELFTSTVQYPDGVKASSSGYYGSLSSATDPNNNTMSGNPITSYSDTLGIQELSYSCLNHCVAGSDQLYSYPIASGTASVTIHTSSYTQQTNFGCPYEADIAPTPAYYISGITLPDGGQYSFTYETTPGDNHTPHYVTGRIASVTLPTGGVISYTYNNGFRDGLSCNTFQSYYNTSYLKRQTPDGTWTYTTSGTSTTVTDPSGNQTVYTFANNYETLRQIYQGSAIPANLSQTIQTCYNGQTCGQSPVGAVSQIDVYMILSPMPQSSHVRTTYDTYGNITDVKSTTSEPARQPSKCRPPRAAGMARVVLR
jgi:hypothetical protein